MNYNLINRYNNLEITQDEGYLDENKYDITGEGEYQEDKDDFLARFTEYVGGLENYADDDLDDDWLIDGRGEDEEDGGEGENDEGEDVIVKLDPAEESSSSSDEEYVISKKKKDDEYQEPQESQEPQEEVEDVEVEEEVLVEITNYDDGDEVIVTQTEDQEKKKKEDRRETQEEDQEEDQNQDQEDVEGSDEKNLMDVDTDDFSGVNELLSQYKEFVYNEN